MTTSYTPLLGLALPVTGELAGTWGDVVSDYITKYVDAAVAGAQTISGTQTAVTLSVTNGSALTQAGGSGSTGSAQYSIINCTGNPAGLLTITAPAASKVYLILNSTSTSQSVKIVGTGPTTGVTIVSGEKALVAWNGSDFVKVASTAAAGGSNTQVQFNNNGVLAGSSSLTWDGTTLSTNGLTASGTVTLSGGTANGVLYLNGSKVATSGSALTFDGTNFATTGSGTLKNLLLSGGTLPGAGNPSIALRSSDNVVYHQSGSANTIVMLDSAQNTMQSIGATAQIWNISNSEQMRLTSTGLGIGTSSPSLKLDVAFSSAGDGIRTYNTLSTGYADVRIGNNTNNNLGYLRAGGSAQGGISQDSLVIGTGGGFPIKIAPQNGSNGVTTFDVNGNLGLGVTPSAWIAYKAFQFGSGTADGSLSAAGDDTNLATNAYYATGGVWKYQSAYKATCYSQSGGAHAWKTAGTGSAGGTITFTQAMTLDASGNLGVGTTSPSQRLHINTAVAGGYGAIALIGNSAGAAADRSGIYGTYNGDYRGGITFWQGATGKLTFHTGNNATPDAGEVMELNSSGNLGLGVTPSAWGSTWKAIQIGMGGSIFARTADQNRIGITANAYFDTAFKYIGTGQASFYDQDDGNHYWYYAASGTAGNAISFTQAMTLNASGQLSIGTTSSSGMLYAVGDSSTGYIQVSDGTGSILLGGSGAVTGGGVTGANAALRTSGNLVFCTGGASEKARIDSSGNLNIGDSGNFGGKISVGFNIASQYGAFFSPSSSTYTKGFIGFNNASGSLVGEITTNGSSTTYATSSDYRLKENIQPMTGALAKVAALKPCTYKWKADGSDGEGFIAHELAEVVPQCVTSEKDAVDADGNPVYQGIDTSFLVATLTAAIKEQQAIIEQLTSRIAALETK